MTVVQGASTAIARKSPPQPLVWLYRKGLIKGDALDYGSGRGRWYGMDAYDPHWRPIKLTYKYDTIVSNYVLNVVDLPTQRRVLAKIRRLLKSGGRAYITVRRDLPKSGKVGRGTFQRYVVLNLPSVRKTTGYEMYVMRGR